MLISLWNSAIKNTVIRKENAICIRIAKHGINTSLALIECAQNNTSQHAITFVNTIGSVNQRRREGY